ncbi:TCR/Tet family MFS transporter [Permianibacter aggregans]|uniref:DHA1 family tetracycline resistance protein-like MFS transporter n=1 Tax=Permianibacter aggregans TaxID=1510150 RepID=A0A4R6USA2_9GAMM|nr:TCR/Tet family MFS transporter [Permianibacter aggregans]QGX38338.1 MFS transporter [Permianibacter aggregans]TDQ48659.1 DHA1 family tetracycline resistance protein-like MFS transporter [Permianibacter aggregans]
MAEPRRAAFVFIFITLILDVLALGIIIPVLPKLVEEFMGGNTANAAQIYGVFGMAWALMQFLFSPFLGALSDRFGRRPIILISCFGLGFDYLLMALAPTLAWLFIGRVISGITAASFSTAGAYIADVTLPEKRAATFGMMGAAWGIGFIVGPAMGGVLGDIDSRLPFWVAGILALINAAYGFFVLPESLPEEKRCQFSWRRANPVGSLKLLRSHPELASLASISFLQHIAHYVLPSTFVLYVGYRYGWNAKVTGLTLAAVGICNVIVQAVLVKKAVALIGERKMLMVALVAGCAGYVIYGLAPGPLWFWAGIPIFAFMGFIGPALQGLMTRRVSASEQGQLQGANSCMMGIAGTFSPLLFTQIFAWFISEAAFLHLPGAPFFLAAVMMVIGLIIVLKAIPPVQGP